MTLTWKPLPAAEVGRTLPSDEVHIWRVSLGQSPNNIRDLVSILSDQERSRANQFLFVRARNRFVVSHGALRQLLGQYLKVEPRLLRFRTTREGKPELTAEHLGSGLQFNLTHSRGMALCAIAGSREVGADIEFMGALPEMEALAEEHFSSREYERFRDLRPEQRPRAFYSWWTKKEACLKACGEGLSFPLNGVGLSFSARDEDGYRTVQKGPCEGRRWKVATLNPAANYLAAVVARGTEWRLRLFDHSTST